MFSGNFGGFFGIWGFIGQWLGESQHESWSIVAEFGTVGNASLQTVVQAASLQTVVQAASLQTAARTATLHIV